MSTNKKDENFMDDLHQYTKSPSMLIKQCRLKSIETLIKEKCRNISDENYSLRIFEDGLQEFDHHKELECLGKDIDEFFHLLYEIAQEKLRELSK